MRIPVSICTRYFMADKKALVDSGATCHDSDGKDPRLSGYDYAGREVSLVVDF
jgi:hypothetical protein